VPGATGTAKPKASRPSATASTNQRPAPAFGAKAATPKPKPKARPSGRASQPAATLTASPGATVTPGATTPTSTKPDPGKKVTDYLPWSKDPGTAWTLLFAASRCDAKSGIAMVPPIANTMDVAKPLPEKQLQAQLAKVTPADLVPAVDNPDRPLIGCDKQGNKTLMSIAPINGTDLKSASAGTQQQSLGEWIVQLDFKSRAAGTFADLSRKMLQGGSAEFAGGEFAIVLDGQVLSTPGFTGVIPDGKAQITGNFTETSAKSLANSLKYGALPVKFDKDVSTEVIGPSLAGNQLDAGIIAGVIGLAIVMLYCLLYYRGLGLVVIASLVIAAMVTYALVLLLAKTAGFTLTLPGIAGLIVAVGITADSFIVYFERIRDEMRSGKSMRVAVQAGWVRARNTCLAADTVSFLAALVLYIFAIGVVKGFAFALGLSTLIDVAVFFWFTHPMVTLLSRYRFFNSGHRYSGLSKETLGVDSVTRDPQLVGRSA
jgi:preprotein translocase subunit SecD